MTGTVVSLLGPNGAGKTTTVRMLATLIAPDGGHARVAGFDVVADAARVRERISLTGQFAALDKHLTARENLVLMARLRGRGLARGPARGRRAARARFDAEPFRDRLVKNLSGGERRRIDLAAGLIDRPHVLVLDEPTTGLDPRSRQVVWTTIRELVAEGVTLLLTTQYLDEADAVADRVVLIDRGREVAAGTPAELKSRVGRAAGRRRRRRRARRSRSCSACSAIASRPRRWPSCGRSRSPRPTRWPIWRASPRRSSRRAIAVDEIALRRPTLDDAFLALTGHTATQ